ncbi:hypothetical protein LTR50_004406 [Elasticomyces elasticus]|nr:hypothetical protein LTR50_004406 [Elasticomyces elasticus]
MATAATLQPTPAHEAQDSQSIRTTLSPSATSTNDITIPRGPVTASLTFYAPPADGAAPWNYVEQPPEGQPQRNYTEDAHRVPISDIRGREGDFTLASHAFATASGIASARETDFSDDAHIAQTYYPEVERLLLAHVPGARRVVLFDHTVRRSEPGARRAPVTRVHIDQTPRSAAMRVRLHLSPDEAEAVLKEERYRIVNVWRPLNGPVVSSPLAFAASDSVPDEDIVAVEHRYPTRSGETAAVKFDPGHRFYYLSGMRDDERLFLQCFDNRGEKARVPHTAFVDPRTQPEWPGRESIEVRALIIG